MREGGLPVSHGICSSCSSRLSTELDAADAERALRAAVMDVERRIEETQRLRRCA
jgi:ferredoxin